MKYTGILAKKIPWVGELSPPGATILGGNIVADLAHKAEVDKRLTALFRHYGLKVELDPPPGEAARAVWKLMMALAQAHVPGFKRERPPAGTKRSRGRPRGSVAKAALSELAVFRAVERLRKENPKLSIRAACGELRRRDRKTYGTESADALRRRYKACARFFGLTRRDMDERTKQSIREQLAKL